MQIDQLILQYGDSANKVVLRLKNGSRRIVRWQPSVGFLIEWTAVSLTVCVRQLQKPLRTHLCNGHMFLLGQLGLSMANRRIWIKPGLGTCERLEKIGPERSLLRIGHDIEARTDLPYIARNPIR